LSFFSVAICVSLAFIVNFFWKISLHSIALGGFLGWLLSIQYSFADTYLLYQFIFVAFLGGIVAWARLYLQQHTIWQILVGYLLGFGICFFTLLIKI
jgi:membrane-associated phospholipid phosphatase